VKPGYFAQASSRLDPRRRLLDEIQAIDPRLGLQKARDWLAGFHFTGDDVDKSVDSLSGGERGRLALACLALQGANLLLLDEPTNHLDLASQESLQDALAAFPGSILLVSHDRYLVRALASQVWTIRPGQAALEVFLGGYEEMLEARRQHEPTRRPATARARSPRRERPRATHHAVRLGLEKRISDLEQSLRDLQDAVSRAGTDVAEVTRLGKEYVIVEEELAARLAEWGDLGDGE
jgi:ATP-binding cassette subfamily F protein 3